MIVKGNEVRNNRNGEDGLVLAVRHDGSAVKVYVYGSDGVTTWLKPELVTVTVDGDETCWKCGGSGLYYFSGATVNGVFQGNTGPCYGCQGSGKQNNADRTRNHWYHHRRSEDYNPVAGEVAGETVTFTDKPKPLAHPKVTRGKSTRKNHPDPERKLKRTVHGVRSTTPATDAAEREPRLIDCECGFMHLDNVPCI